MEGAIERAELRDMLLDFGVAGTPTKIDQLLDKCDVHGDGFIPYDHVTAALNAARDGFTTPVLDRLDQSVVPT